MNLHSLHRKIAFREGPWAHGAWLLSLPSLLWRLSAALRRSVYDAGLLPRVSLRTVVVSVGNIEMGGVGKTPVTLWIAEELSRLGLRTAVVAKNLAVRRAPPVAVLPGSAGGGIPLSDEAVMLGARLHPRSRVFAGADKTATAVRAFQEAAPDVILLDDGFQHLRLHRDLEVLVLNALHPFGMGGVFPMGSLRESPGVLSRADFLWLNRVSGGVAEKLARRLCAQKNWKAPFITSRVVPGTPRDSEGGEREPCDVVAFAGIGNPDAFRETLLEAGFGVKAFYRFPDHWNYTARDCAMLTEALRSLPADELVTTEKDAARLGRKGMAILRPLVLPITLSVEGARDDFLGRILDLVEARKRHETL